MTLLAPLQGILDAKLDQRQRRVEVSAIEPLRAPYLHYMSSTGLVSDQTVSQAVLRDMVTW